MEPTGRANARPMTGSAKSGGRMSIVALFPDCAPLHPGYEASDSRAGLGRRHPELGFQRGDPGLQRLVFLTRQTGHILDRVELLALDEVEVAQDALGLVADDRVDLSLDALGCAGGVVHQTADLVEKPIVGLGHLKNAPVAATGSAWSKTLPAPRQWRSRGAGSRAWFKSPVRACRSTPG